ncbi:hypothetical protein [Thioclava sp.]|uniref:hypothetical protein n=1 Tax=Thioclava sp. TaxID=1933450 RepID=UPI003242181F
MNIAQTSYEIEVSRIKKSYGPRYFARVDAIDEERGWSALTRNPERDEILRRIDVEESERIAEEIASISEALRVEYEETKRSRYLDGLAGKLVGDGQKPEELDGFQVFLRAGFLGIDMETRRELLKHLEKKKEAAA